MTGINTLTVDFAIIFGVASLTIVLAKKIHLPIILGYILAGIIVGPYLPIPLFANKERVLEISELGVILVMFSIGLEFNIKKIFQLIPSVGIGAIEQMLTLFSVGTILGQLWWWDLTKALILGSTIAISSTIISNKSMESIKISKGIKDFVYGVLVLQDLVGILIITVLSTIIAGKTLEYKIFLNTFIKMFLFVIVMGGFGIVIVPRFIKRVLKLNSRETITVVAIGICFSFALMAELAGYSVALGAFLAGVLISESGRGDYFEENISQIRAIFSAMFFISVGMSFDPYLSYVNFHYALILSLSIIIFQFFSIMIGGILSGYGMKTSVTSALALGQIGEFSFIISSLALGAGLIDVNFYSILVTTAAITSITTSLFLQYHENILEIIDIILPSRLKTLIIVYLNWFNSIKNRENPSPLKISKYVRTILISSIIMIILSSVLSVLFSQFEKYVGVSNIDLLKKKNIYPIIEIILLAPFIILTLLSTSNLIKKLSEELFFDESKKISFFSLIRFSLTLFVSLVLCIVIMIATLPFVKVSIWTSLLVVLVLFIFLYIIWKKSYVIQEQMESSFENFFRNVIRKNRRQVNFTIDIPQNILPGMEDVNLIKIEKNSSIIGKTIREVNLRAKTGVTILSIVRNGSNIHLPSADEVFEQNDFIALVGGENSIEKAKEILMTSSFSEKPVEKL